MTSLQRPYNVVLTSCSTWEKVKNKYSKQRFKQLKIFFHWCLNHTSQRFKNMLEFFKIFNNLVNIIFKPSRGFAWHVWKFWPWRWSRFCSLGWTGWFCWVRKFVSWMRWFSWVRWLFTMSSWFFSYIRCFFRLMLWFVRSFCWIRMFLRWMRSHCFKNGSWFVSWMRRLGLVWGFF